MEKRKIVFLYTELATYFLACVEELIRQPAIEVHIIRWEVNKEAPFNFAFSPDIHVYKRTDYSDKALMELVEGIGPSVVYVSGWMDKGYLRICKHFFNKNIPVIVGFDNQWKGTFRQNIAKLISRFKILNHFSHCWVPGEPQRQYALRLGFSEKKILSGFYSCDFNLFHQQYLANRQQKERSFPKRFIYVGRYVEHKGIRDLWQAFIELQKEDPSDWELWCLGTGDIEPVIHPRIKHFGFVQPSAMKKFISETGVFVLPSHFEPWGVVVHEFAAAGFPMICSDEVGARSTFVENDLNGYIYKAGNIRELKDALLKIVKASPADLLKKAEQSVKKAEQITPKKWAEKLMSVL